MEKFRIYELEGTVLKIPLRYDEQTKIYIEDYIQFFENQQYTSLGHPIMFAGEDACEHAQEATGGGCPDCGSCRFYVSAGEHSWIGICKRDTIIRQNE